MPSLTDSDLFARLDALSIAHKTYEHAPVFTVEEAAHLYESQPGGHTKNLFLKDKKDGLWLVVCRDALRVDMNALSKTLDAPRFSFGSAELLVAMLGVQPGSVTPFAIANDTDSKIRIVLDEGMLAYDILNFHPLRNDRTTAISSADLLKFIRATGHEPIIAKNPGTPDMTPVTSLGPRDLKGKFVTLEPLAAHHHAPLLAAAASNKDIWRYIPVDPEKGYAARLPATVAENKKGSMLTFVVRRNADGAIVGSTSYLNIVPHDARVEIGFTWYVPDAQGGAVNPECKYLLLANAFAAHYNRVEFKTDAKNAQSRAALAKLGAKEEGILRGHMWMPQGYFRDSVYFSILVSEWPNVKSALEKRLSAFG